ncbi:NAD-dependent epimerase/dehydratase family protein [Rhizomonospora bruguierae]|uniref:NAD-dependent epimerase/dehydratase family protein n=1 Tax=Rhizomonospora bruguierae TaxID=1581705 RepID=UPI001BD184E3|nr:NAD-dependent epimerase/dehydratase family protein [Micromonospora sp. NBRC 107566]
MRLLILGGTAFLGRAVATHALSAGHEVICAARGRSGSVPPGAQLVPVDRDDPDGLAVLDGGQYDAVVDVSRHPLHVRRAVAALAGRVGHWGFVSTGNVYADDSTPGQRAGTAPLREPLPAEKDDVALELENYGPAKVACERSVLASGVPALIARVGLLVGPRDPSGRFAYWPDRLARGGEVLAPGDPADPVQWIDARDVAAFLIAAAQRRLAGVFDVVGAPVPRAEFLAGVAAGVRGEREQPRLTWVPQAFLAEQAVNPWAGPRSLPLWLPLPEYGGFLTRDASAALAAGLTTRPVSDSARDTLAWLADHPEGLERAGLSAEDEAKVLAEWHAHQS